MAAKGKNETLKNRRPANLAADLDKSLLGYATAASAAGVGLLALAQPAEAKVVYTASNTPITVNGPAVPLDLNHDGVADFSFFNLSGTCEHAKRIRRLEGCSFAYMEIIAAQTGNEIGSSQTFNGAQCAAELRAGHLVANNKKFKPTAASMFEIVGTSGDPGSLNCLWHGKGNSGGYLGLKFVVKGETFYGWAHVSLTPTGPVLSGYAYEDVANQSIKTGATRGAEDADASHPALLPAPQPASLGMLALGARGVAIWRRPKEMN
jgi:hypothetical protein